MQNFHLTGRISADFGSQLEVIHSDGTTKRLTHFTHLQRPIVGDLVQYQEGQLLKVLPRNNQLNRIQSNGKLQTLAANVDEVWLCIPLDREPSLGRIERFSHFVRSQGLNPLIILSKLDLCENPQPWISLATAIGLEVILCSVPKNMGIDELQSRLAKEKTILLLGQSGAGKTTLANQLAGTNYATHTVRDSDHRGQHTTVSRQLIPTPNGGYLLDIPGFRELVWEEQTQLPDAWKNLTLNCRFANCAHQGDEGCALEQAIKTGEISEDSLTYWRKLQKETAYRNRMTHKVESANSKKRWKAINKQTRAWRKQEYS